MTPEEEAKADKTRHSRRAGSGLGSAVHHFAKQVAEVSHRWPMAEVEWVEVTIRAGGKTTTHRIDAAKAVQARLDETQARKAVDDGFQAAISSSPGLGGQG